MIQLFSLQVAVLYQCRVHRVGEPIRERHGQWAPKKNSQSFELEIPQMYIKVLDDKRTVHKDTKVGNMITIKYFETLTSQKTSIETGIRRQNLKYIAA